MQLVERNIALLLGIGAALSAPAGRAAAQSVFQPPAIHPIGAHSSLARVADLDRNGKADALTGGPGNAIFFGGTLRTHFGDGKGGFGNPNDLGFFATDFDFADMTGDGLVDLVSVEVPGLSIHPGNGAGAFGASLTIVYVGGGGRFTIGDFDLDGSLDVVAALTTNPQLSLTPSIFRGNGKGGLSFVGSLPGAGLFLASADMNGDGKPDVVTTAKSNSPALRVYLGNGLGGFSPLPEVSLASFGPAGPLAIGDVNGDKTLDVATRGSDAAGVSAIRVLLGDGLGGLVVDPAAGFSAPGAPFPLIADLDADGIEDLAATSDSQGAFLYRLASAAGVFDPAISIPVAGGPVRCVLADFDSNGRPDVLITTPGVESFAVLMGILPPAPGTFTFGLGTAGCLGRHGIVASGVATPGSSTFYLENTNVAPGTLGLFLVTDQPDFAGSDSAGIGVVLHVDPIASSGINYFYARGDAGGVGIAHLPIPNNPVLSGLTFFAQGLWSWALCRPTVLSLSSSPGLRITLP
jgi:VCBS repeat protein